MGRENFSDNFMKKITQDNYTKINKSGRIINFRNKSNRGTGKRFRNGSIGPEITDNLKDIRGHDILVVHKETTKKPLRPKARSRPIEKTAS